MRINAYILAADPAWIEASVLSYYDAVDEIIVSYDENSIGYTGVPVDVEQCLSRLRAIDSKEKLRYCPGFYARTECTPMDNETYQRQKALDEASKGADWVLQLDTDEIVFDTHEFISCLHEADSKGFDALDYPSRWFYRQLGENRYLESCNQRWGIVANYPGVMAVKSNTILKHARQFDGRLFRVDFKPYNTDPWRAPDTPVHRVVKFHQAIFHYSMVRKEEALRKKTLTWSHAKDRNWGPELSYWAWCGKHPYLACLKTPFTRRAVNTHRSRLRISQIDPPNFMSPYLHDE